MVCDRIFVVGDECPPQDVVVSERERSDALPRVDLRATNLFGSNGGFFDRHAWHTVVGGNQVARASPLHDLAQRLSRGLQVTTNLHPSASLESPIGPNARRVCVC